MKAYKVTVHKKENEQDIYTSIFTYSEFYSLTYKEGEITEADNETFGVFCFDSIEAAYKYIEEHFGRGKYVGLFEVEGIGEAYKPEMMSCSATTYALMEYYRCWNKNIIMNEGVTFGIPDGTICFPKVRVLRQLDIREMPYDVV